jgi:GAF domain-containing protein
MTTPIPTNVAYDTAATFSFQGWRNNFLKRMLRIALIVGALFLLATYLTPTETILRIIYTTLLVLLLLANLLPLPYSIKSLLFVVMLLTLGTSGLLENGIRGDSRVFLIAFVVMTGTLFGNRAGIIANGLSALIMAIFGWLILSGNITILTKKLDIGVIDTWAVAILENMGISALIGAVIAWLERDFAGVLDSVAQAFYALRQERESLENRVKERTITLERKASQLKAASTVARETAIQRDLRALLNQTVNLITEQFGFYHAGIFLLDDAKKNAILQAASSEGGRKMIERGHRLGVGQQGIVGEVAYQNRPRIALDVGQDSVFFKNPDLPLTRSEVAIPLSVRSTVIGVLDIQSTEPAAFTQDDIDLLQTLADQIALGIQNARLIEESRTTLSRLEAALSENVRQAWREHMGTRRRAYQYTQTGIALLPQLGEAKDAPAFEGDTAKLSIPISLRDQRIGNIILQRKAGNTWGEADKSLVIEVANQVGLALENARLLQDAQRLASREQQISTISALIQQSTDLDTVLQNTVRELGRALGTPNTFIQIGLSPTEDEGANQNTNK